MKSNLVNTKLSVDTKEYLEKLAVVTYLLKQLDVAIKDLNNTQITVSAKTKENTTTANSDVCEKIANEIVNKAGNVHDLWMSTTSIELEQVIPQKLSIKEQDQYIAKIRELIFGK